MKTKDIQELYQIKLHSMDTILHQISLMDQVENEQELSEIIHSLLQAIGKYTGADRVYVFDWETDQKDSLSNTFEWCADEVTPEIANLQAIPVSLMPNWVKRFENKEAIVINDLEATKYSEPEEYELLKTQEICSLIAVPIYANHQMNGFIGVDNPDLRHNEISITLLSDVGGHLGCMRENLKSTILLKKALDEATKRSEIILAIATLYVTIVHVNVKERTYELLKGHDLVQKIFGQKGKIDDVMERLPTTFAAKEWREQYREFLDFDTLAERLRNTNFVSNEFMNINGEWRVSRFIVKSRDTQGNVVDVLYVVRDITEEKLRELMYQKQLKASMEDAQRANISKTAFLQRMSHDIRTPLNGIVGMIHIAEKHKNDVAKLREFRQKVLQSTDYLQKLINNVLDISKLESGSLMLEYKSFDLVELLSNNMTVVAMSAYENGVRFEGGVEANTIRHRYLIGSPVHLSRVLMNLASNAIKYNHFHGTVNVHCEELSDDGNMAVFKFVCSDTGLGMSEEFQKHAFDVFAQEGKQSTTTFSGSGLGLSIVKDIIELMGGMIELESKENVGSTFTVTVPFKIDHLVENNDSQKDSCSQSMELSGKRVLLVEDNAINMEIAHAILEEEHLNITEAKNGKEALEIFQNSKLNEYDVIIMDVMMPVMDGLEATKAIRMLEREDAKRIPIIAMTANAFEEDRKACLDAGMDEHIGKPIDILICPLSSRQVKYLK
ncbi:MAG: response regulator [Clostridiales bacterium]|nr:response regulator [Clostridiales bacterium]